MPQFFLLLDLGNIILMANELNLMLASASWFKMEDEALLSLTFFTLHSCSETRCSSLLELPLQLTVAFFEGFYLIRHKNLKIYRQ